MKAKCIFCEGKGCKKCKDGFMDVDLARGLVYSLVCKKCNNVVGMHIDEGNCPPEKDTYFVCPICRDKKELEWRLDSYSFGG